VDASFDGREGLVLSDLVGNSSVWGAVLHERVGIIAHDEPSQLVLQLELSTSDLGAFEDMTGTCVDLLASVQLRAAGAAL